MSFGSISFKNPVVKGNYCELVDGVEGIEVGCSVVFVDGRIRQATIDDSKIIAVVCSKDDGNFISNYIDKQDLASPIRYIVTMLGCCSVLKTSIKNPSWIFVREIDDVRDCYIICSYSVGASSVVRVQESTQKSFSLYYDGSVASTDGAITITRTSLGTYKLNYSFEKVPKIFVQPYKTLSGMTSVSCLQNKNEEECIFQTFNLATHTLSDSRFEVIIIL